MQQASTSIEDDLSFFSENGVVLKVWMDVCARGTRFASFPWFFFIFLLFAQSAWKLAGGYFSTEKFSVCCICALCCLDLSFLWTAQFSEATVRFELKSFFIEMIIFFSNLNENKYKIWILRILIFYR